jgi:hypothetical protein
MIVAWYVVVIHFITRAVMLEFSNLSSRESIANRDEKDYFKWEGMQINIVYLFPYLAFFTMGLFPFVVTMGLCIFVAILRSIEHIDKNIIN